MVLGQTRNFINIGEVMEMKRVVPHKPPPEDLAVRYQFGSITTEIYTTYLKTITPEERLQIDKNIADIVYENLVRQSVFNG